ncbi:MAG: CHRD domain-containing protein [Planctomycetota bacterium]|jgi:hypothetical protein
MTRTLLRSTLALLLAAPAAAEVITYEYPCTAVEADVISPAWGVAVVTFDDATNLLTWDIEYHGMTGEAFAAHFHGPAAPNEVADVRLNISPTIIPDDPFNGCIVGSGTIDGTMAAELTAGLWYVNIHTMAFLEGELRGQVVDAPVCLADLNDSGDVGFDDILVIIGAWGPCGLPATGTGACCSAAAVCVDDLDPATCATLGLFYQGDGTTCAAPGVDCERACYPDIDGSGAVGFGDILRVIANWGPCS